MNKEEKIRLNKKISLENWTNWSTSAWFIDLKYQNYFPKEYTNHPGQTTFEVYYRLILIFTKIFDRILDPFSGTGTAAIVSRLIDRNSLGIEINEEFHKISIKNLSNYKVNPTTEQNLILSNSSFYSIEPESFDYIVTSPPYYNNIRYSNNKNDLSHFSNLDSYIQNIGNTLVQIGKGLKKGKNMSIIIGDAQKKNSYIPIHCLIVDYLKRYNWKLTHLWINFISDSSKRKSPKKTIGYPKRMYPEFNHEYILNFEKD